MTSMLKPKIIILALVIVMVVPILFKSQNKSIPAYNNHQQTQVQKDDSAPAFKNKIQATKS